MVDGVGGNDLMTQIFSTDPGEPLPAAARWDPAPPPSLAELAAGDLRAAMTRPFRRLAAAPACCAGSGPRNCAATATASASWPVT